MDISHIICPMCSVGCGLDFIVKDKEVVGTHPYKSHHVNEGRNCNDGRKSFEIVNNDNRLLNSFKNENGKLVEADLDELIDSVSSDLKSTSADDIAFLVSERTSNANIKALKQIADGLGVSNIGFYSNNFKNMGEFNPAKYEDINNADFILTIGDVFLDHPLIGRRIYMAQDKGAGSVAVDTLEKTFSGINSDEYKQVSDISSFLDDVPFDIESKLTDSSVILIEKLDSPEDFDKVKKLAEKTKAKILPVLECANSKGALELINPLTKDEIVELVDNTKLLYVLGEIDILSDIDSIKQVDNIITQNYNSNDITDLSNTVIASACWAEEDGSFTNSEGTLQYYNKALNPPENVSTNLEILNKIAEKLSIDL